MKDKFYSFLEKYSIYIGIFLILIILAGALFICWNKPKSGQILGQTSIQIRIDIEGAVQNPGVFEFESGAIVEDAIAKAGGLNDKVDGTKLAQDINRAATLTDGQKIFIPVIGTASADQTPAENQTGSQTSASQTSTGIVNINTADATALDSLPGIGPAYSQRIIDYRTQNGKFKSIDEIKNIKGIGDKTFEKLRDLITI